MKRRTRCTHVLAATNNYMLQRLKASPINYRLWGFEVDRLTKSKPHSQKRLRPKTLGQSG